MVAEIGAFLEVQPEQPAHEAVLNTVAGRTRPADDAMGVERIRGDPDGVEGEGDALGRTQVHQALVDLRYAGRIAELRQHVLLAVDAALRDRRVELVGTPVDNDVDFGDGGDGPVQALLADVAPRTDDVRNDVDGNGLAVAHRSSFAGHSARHQVGSWYP